MKEDAFSFGPFRISPRRRTLSRAGEQVRLGSRAFDILAVLVEHDGDLVDKRTLLARVWPDTVVDEVALRVHLSSLRKVVGETPERTAYIANIPGRGYRLNVPVQPIAEGSGRVEPAPSEIRQRLPTPATRLLGRDDTIEALQDKLGETRFVSIVGPGGIGKTSVAIEVAHRSASQLRDGAVLIDFAPLVDSALMASTVAVGVGAIVHSADPVRGLVAHLRDKELLLVLDNCEYVIGPAAALIEALLLGAPGISILATCRESLLARGEWVHRLAPLAFPTSPGANMSAVQALQFPAIELLIERTRASHDSFRFGDADVEVVADLCRKLDGIPLAIELAAAIVENIGLRGVATQSEHWLSLLVRGRRTAAPHHQSLRAVLDWSHNLLLEEEKIILRRFAIFRGGATADAASDVIADWIVARPKVLAGILSLAGKSLIVLDIDGDCIRYRLLETARMYALERLQASDDFDAVSQRHAQHQLASLRRFNDSDLCGEPKKSFAECGGSLDDLRAALGWAMSARGDMRLGLVLLADSALVWFGLALAAEYRRYLEGALAQFQSAPEFDAAIELSLCASLGQAIWLTLGPNPQMIAAYERVRFLSRSTPATMEHVQALWGLWNQRNISGDVQSLVSLTEEARRVTEGAQDEAVRLTGERLQALSAQYLGHFEDAWFHHQRSKHFSDSAYIRLQRIAFQLDQKLSMGVLDARLLWFRGCFDQSHASLDYCLEYARARDLKFDFCYMLGFAACPIALWSGDLVSARSFVDLLKERSATYSLDFWHGLSIVYELAIDLPGRNDQLHTESADILPGGESIYSFHQLELFATLHERLVAARLRQHARNVDHSWCASDLLRTEARAAQRCGDEDRAEFLFREAIALARRQSALYWELRAAVDLARHWHRRGRTQDARSVLSATCDRVTEGDGMAHVIEARHLLRELAAPR